MPMKHITISLDEKWWLALKAKADEEGVSLSRFLAESGAERMPEEVRKSLPALRGRGNPGKGGK